ncbi:MAG: YybH family protein [Chthoniobacterales bacterium]
MNKSSHALLILFLAVAPALVSAAAGPQETVQQFVDGFNKGDLKMAAATCADEMSIIDEFPPYLWHGAGAFKSWTDDYDADAKKKGIANGVVTLHKPSHVEVVGEYAYVVNPTDYSWQQKGKPMKETNSLITIALHQHDGNWQIVAWTWSKH